MLTLASEAGAGGHQPPTQAQVEALALAQVQIQANIDDTGRRQQRQENSQTQSEDWEELALQFAVMTNAANVPAAALVVVEKGKVALLRGFGTATVDTPFRLGSITKTFTALALLHAAAASKVELDTPASRVIGEDHWSNRWRATNPVTLAQLIELSAGFGDISGAEFASAGPLPRRRALAQHRASHKTLWPPGLQHSYSNLPPAFSALAVEALSKSDFAHYLEKHVLLPLGMETASIAPVRGLPGGFKADGATPIEYWHTIYPAFGGLNATPREFSRFLLRLSQADFPAELQRAIALRGDVPLYQPTTTAASRQGLAIGYGSGIYGSLRSGHLIAGHGGDADGYRSRYGIVPANQRGYFLVINTDNPTLLRRLQQLIEQTLVADLPAARWSQNTTLTRVTQGATAAFAGHYYQASARFSHQRWQDCQGSRATLELADNGLRFGRGTRTRLLVAAGKQLFRTSNASIPTVALIEDTGSRYLQGELGNWVQVPKPTSCPDGLAAGAIREPAASRKPAATGARNAP